MMYQRMLDHIYGKVFKADECRKECIKRYQIFNRDKSSPSKVEKIQKADERKGAGEEDENNIKTELRV